MTVPTAGNFLSDLDIQEIRWRYNQLYLLHPNRYSFRRQCRLADCCRTSHKKRQRNDRRPLTHMIPQSSLDSTAPEIHPTHPSSQWLPGKSDFTYAMIQKHGREGQPHRGPSPGMAAIYQADLNELQASSILNTFTRVCAPIHFPLLMYILISQWGQPRSLTAWLGADPCLTLTSNPSPQSPRLWLGAYHFAQTDPKNDSAQA